ncbi:MAG TPA: RNA polymerase sigma factor, partial [Chloroflexota bacterium]|nr:RNA polymerase sigma factor [Chloroflexota bacterium]
MDRRQPGSNFAQCTEPMAGNRGLFIWRGRRLAGNDWAEVERRILPLRGEAVRAAALILGRRQLAEDAVQEAFMRASRGLSGLRDPEAAPAWFRRIVVREALRMARRDAREVPDPATPDSRVAGPVERTEAAAEREQARRALQSLSPARRSAVALHHGLGLPVAAVAAILGVPAGTVKSRCAAARVTLRSRMDRPLPEVCELAEEGIRLLPGSEIERENRRQVADGLPTPTEISEHALRGRFREVDWPTAGSIGLPFHSGRFIEEEGVRQGWAFYAGDDESRVV